MAITQATSWSHSRLGDFENCKLMFKLKHIDRIPEPERPLPPGKTEHANDRGSRIHQHAEDFVKGTAPEQIPEMAEFAPEFNQLRHLFTKGLVSLEGEWAVDQDWAPMDWNGAWAPIDELDAPEEVADLKPTKILPVRGKQGDYVKLGKILYVWVPAWHRSKVDSIVIPTPYSAIVIDYKSGRKFGNEVKHAEQTQLYALNAVLRYPQIETVTTELWYLDAKELTSATFTRSQILRFRPNFDRRGRAVTNATDFPPNSNVHSCKWCQYGPWNGGQCKVGVRR